MTLDELIEQRKRFTNSEQFKKLPDSSRRSFHDHLTILVSVQETIAKQAAQIKRLKNMYKRLKYARHGYIV